MQTIAQAQRALSSGQTTARQLVETALERIAAPGGEGSRVFVRVYEEAARASAEAMDGLRRVGREPSPLAGIPISIKDLFDVRGERTAAGSRVLKEAAPATRHAAVVSRCLAAGLVPVGRTNMTEFAFSGIGINPHFGTPKAPWRREAGHVPGGSSSGAAVSVADGMALAGLGTDTGGSCRIPAAFCGVVGYKPTARRVPLEGVLPLSPSLDSVGPLANSVACCAAIDAVLAGEALPEVKRLELRGMRLAVPGNMVMEGMEPAVAEAFNRALNRLSNFGVRITHLNFPQFERIAEANKTGGFSAAEAHVWHRAYLADQPEVYDQRVRARLERGAGMSAGDMIALIAARRDICADMDRATAPFDAVAMPTAPIAPPTIDSLANDADFTRANMLALRNTSLGNFLDRCAISLPMQRAGEPPAGFMLMGETMGDQRLFAIAAAVESVLKE
ncbi:MAG: amidase [Acetobacteraceae bacterium]|nr:amidase [Acetobacteraceae bacterium]